MLDCILIFNSIHRVMKAESILKKEGLKFRLIPTPRSLTSDCGLAIEMNGKDIEEFKKVLSKGGVKIAEAHVESGKFFSRLF